MGALAAMVVLHMCDNWEKVDMTEWTHTVLTSFWNETESARLLLSYKLDLQ